MRIPDRPYSDEDVLALRPAKNAVDPARPYAFFVEPECAASGRVEDVATIFLTNAECPFRCTMCDLWKNTLDAPTPRGVIPGQIEYALSRLPPARHVKLYNSGNFFDARAIPAGDHPAIAQRLGDFNTVIVENHPRLCTRACARFRDRLAGELEIALGLETAHPAALAFLNKRMTVADFTAAARLLKSQGIAVRAFILLKPPLVGEAECVDWALRSMDVAFSSGAHCVSLIPTRTGNGIMDRLEREELFSPPSLASIEQALEAGLNMHGGRVFVDLWEIERLITCPKCGPARIERVRRMNLEQAMRVPVACDCRIGQ